MTAPRPNRAATREQLQRLLPAALADGDQSLRAFMQEHSNLPGPRGNLELARDFADAVASLPAERQDTARAMCLAWTEIDAIAAPVGDPGEYLPFCGAWALGVLAAATGEQVPETRDRLRVLASDPRWRLREAVANGLQALLQAAPAETVAALGAWIRPGSWLEMRAVAAALAEPAVLRVPGLAQEATDLHQRLLDVCEAADDRGPDFRVLRQSLGYTVSVVAVADSAGGAGLLERLARSPDPDCRWVLKQNLRKNRLRRAYPELVQRLEAKTA